MAYPSPGYGTQSDPTSVMGRRIGAFFIDLVILIIVGVAAFIGSAEDVSPQQVQRKCPDEFRDAVLDDVSFFSCDGSFVLVSNGDLRSADIGPVFGTVTVASFLYVVILQGLTGATLAKLMVGIRVVNREGTKPGVGRALVRWLFFVVDGPFSLFLAGLITSVVSPGHRRVGDMVAGTYVVRADAAGYPVPVPGNADAMSFPGAPMPPPPTGYGQPVRPPAPSAPSGEAQWDPIKGTYIVWDGAAGKWMEWNADRGAWEPGQ